MTSNACRIRWAAVAVALLALSGCYWPMPGGGWNRQGSNPFEERITVGTVPRLEQVWDATVDAGPAGDPVTSIAGVHVADDQSVYLFDQRTGARRWQHTAPGTMFQPYVWGDRVLASQHGPTAADTRTVFLDARTGAVEADRTGWGVAALRGDVAVLLSTRQVCIRFVCYSEDTLLVQDLVTGEALLNGSFNATGQPLDQHAVTLGSDWLVHGGVGLSNLSNPAELNHGVRGYSMSVPSPYNCNVLSLCPNWIVDGVTGRPVLGDDDAATIYAGSGDLTAIEGHTGSVLWRSEAPGFESAPALAGGMLFTSVPGALGVPDRLDAYPAAGCGAATCPPAWSAELDTLPNTGGPVLQPAVAGGVVFLAGEGGILYAFDAEGCGAATCGPLWSGAAGSEITGAPAVSNGQVYVGTADGRLVAFGLPPT
jgi:outer membrane protein assembly factor BamB